jgi:hypothetical protein
VGRRTLEAEFILRFAGVRAQELRIHVKSARDGGFAQAGSPMLDPLGRSRMNQAVMGRRTCGVLGGVIGSGRHEANQA